MELQRKISGLKLRSKLNQKIEEATQIILRRKKNTLCLKITKNSSNFTCTYSPFILPRIDFKNYLLCRKLILFE